MLAGKPVLCAFAAGFAVAGASAAQAASANTLKDMFVALNQCLATVRLPMGTDVTLQFMLNRRGALIGKPRLTHTVWPPDADRQVAAGAIASGFDRCVPLEITDALGGAIAGRLFSFRLRAAPAQEKV